MINDNSKYLKKPRVSVGLPVYDGEGFLEQTLDSLLAQTFPDFKIVISNNSSTDSTEAICRAYAERDRRIKYRRNDKNLGAADNYNIVYGHLSRWFVFDKAGKDVQVTDVMLCRTSIGMSTFQVSCKSV